jgi:RimJ/RimL family protein N-acetyltransferase
MLKGKRVLLRAAMRQDLEAMHAWANDLDVELSGGGDPPKPFTFDAMAAQFEQQAAKAEKDTLFVIEVEGRPIGMCGVHRLEECKGVNRNAEFGIGIGDKSMWGKGYGTEATELILHWAFVYRNLHRVWLGVLSNNHRAIRCYQKCGFVEEGRMREHMWSNGKYHDLVIMGALRDEWLPSRSAS